MQASDPQIALLSALFDERKVDSATYHIWTKQLANHCDPASPVLITGWQAGVLIENFKKLPRRNRSYTGRHSA